MRKSTIKISLDDECLHIWECTGSSCHSSRRVVTHHGKDIKKKWKINHYKCQCCSKMKTVREDI